MVAYNIQFGQGITVGAGITIGNVGGGSTTLVITANDFANYSTNNGGGGSLTAANTNGYNYAGGGDLVNPYYVLSNPAGGTVTRIQNAFTAAGLDINHVYVFDATFYLENLGAGQQTGVSRKVRMSYYVPSNNFYVLAVDETNTNWTSDPYLGTALNGQFSFPLTINVSSGVQSQTSPGGGSGDWC